MTRGPAPKPTQLLKLTGSWRAKTRQGEPEAPRGKPKPPQWFDANQRDGWKWLVEQLESMNLLHLADRATMVLFAEAWGEFVEAVKAIRKDGRTVTTARGGTAMHPMIRVKNQAADRINRMAQQFGLSPAARTRVKAAEETPTDQGKGRFFKGKQA